MFPEFGFTSFGFTVAQAQIRRQQIEDTLKNVVQVTRDLIAEGGWSAAQISVIANRAGLATGSVYRYFDSKVDLCVQVLSQVSQREAEVAAAIIDCPGDATSRLHDAVATFVRRAAREPRLAYALIAEPCEPALDEARLQYRDGLAKQFARLIVEGTRRGEFIDMPSDVLSTCVTGAMMEPLIRPLARTSRPQKQEIETLAEQVATACVRMVRATAPALTSIKKTRRA
jgi:AcrR family transcriptional regulator